MADEEGIATLKYSDRKGKRALFDGAEEGGPAKAAKTSSGRRGGRNLDLRDFQFYNLPAIAAIDAEEAYLQKQEAAQREAIDMLREKESGNSSPQMSDHAAADDDMATMVMELVTGVKKDFGKAADRFENEFGTTKFSLPSREKSKRRTLLSEGFSDWSKKDFKLFTESLERHGRSDPKSVCREVSFDTGKGEAEVARYMDVFWKRYKELNNWEELMEKVESGERKTRRIREIKDAISEKVAPLKNPLRDMRLSYGSNKGKCWSDEEDSFLVVMMNRHGYGAWDSIVREIREAWQFKFNFFFTSRSASEINKRCDILIKCIERESLDSKAKASK